MYRYMYMYVRVRSLTESTLRKTERYTGNVRAGKSRIEQKKSCEAIKVHPSDAMQTTTGLPECGATLLGAILSLAVKANCRFHVEFHENMNKAKRTCTGMYMFVSLKKINRVISLTRHKEIHV